MKRAGVAFILVLAFSGVAVSTYLAQSESRGTALTCGTEGLSGCNDVVNSKYSKMFGVSLATYGLLFFTTLFVLAAFELFLFNQLLRHALQAFSVVALLFAIYSIVIQVFVLNKLCIYCLTVAAISVSVFVFATMIEPVRNIKHIIGKKAVPAA